MKLRKTGQTCLTAILTANPFEQLGSHTEAEETVRQQILCLENNIEKKMPARTKMRSETVGSARQELAYEAAR